MQSKSLTTPAENSNSDDTVSLADVVIALGEVDLNDPLAKENELSYSDNNGGRVLL